MRSTYQLVRNVLAACVRDDGSIDHSSHAVILFDDRNPAFFRNGIAEQQWQVAIRAIRRPTQLRRCSWQRLAAHLARAPDLSWL